MAYEKQNFVDGNVLKAEHLNHMEEGIERASTQPDWNQNDETAADYVKNRTHYAEAVTVEETVIFEAANRQVADYGGGPEYPLDISKEFVSGCAYTVELNGTTFDNLIAFVNENGRTCIGAENEESTLSDMPFYFVTTYSRNGFYKVYCYINTDYTYGKMNDDCGDIAYTHDIKITMHEHQSENTVKIEEKYIDSVGVLNSLPIYYAATITQEDYVNIFKRRTVCWYYGSEGMVLIHQFNAVEGYDDVYGCSDDKPYELKTNGWSYECSEEEYNDVIEAWAKNRWI